MPSPTWRAGLALLLFSAWMGLLFGGFLLGGALHLLLVGAAVLFPWRSVASPLAESDPPPIRQQPPDDRSGGS